MKNIFWKQAALAVLLAGGAVAAQQPSEAGGSGQSAGGSAVTAQGSSATGTPQVPQTARAAAPAGAKAPGAAKKGKKDVYTGPTEVVELPPTPMLDEEGKQRLDTDGKPMWNAPVRQMRDKKGHPVFDEKGKPVFQTKDDLGFDEHGKRIKVEKVKPPKTTPVSIVAGTYTVDGVTGKAQLNYDIADLKFVYLYVPGMGIAVVSNDPFPGATLQKDAFQGKTLTVNVEGHTLQLFSEKLLLGKKPEPAYVMLDRQFRLPSRFPVMGYGTTLRPPYAWPGAKEVTVAKDALAPPPPKDMQPVKLLKPCQAGYMRMAGPPVLPGQVAPEQPCVPIPKGQARVVPAADAKKAAAPPATAVAPATAATPATAVQGAGAPGNTGSAPPR